MVHQEDSVDIYVKQIRSVLEFGTPVWNSGLTKQEVEDIERVQKSFLRIILGPAYNSYENALKVTELDKLETRRTSLCIAFATKCAKDP